VWEIIFDASSRNSSVIFIVFDFSFVSIACLYNSSDIEMVHATILQYFSLFPLFFFLSSKKNKQLFLLFGGGEKNEMVEVEEKVKRI